MSQNVKDKNTSKESRSSARSPYTSYTEYLAEDSQKVPTFMVEENFEFLGSDDISAWKDILQKNTLRLRRNACGLGSGNLHAELKIFQM